MVKIGLLGRFVTSRLGKILASAVLAAGIAVVIGLVVVGFEASKHARAVLSIRHFGADIKDCVPAAKWLSAGVLANVYHPPVCSVSFWGDVGADQFAQLEYLPELKVLFASGDHTTDAAMHHLRSLCNLEVLALDRTVITDSGLRDLESLTLLRALSLPYASVTDAGLIHLRALRNLRDLCLVHTRITDAGLRELSGLNELRSLDVSENARITDAGLVHLYSLTMLTDINVFGTAVTMAGVRNLKAALPNCKIFIGSPVRLPAPKSTSAELVP